MIELDKKKGDSIKIYILFFLFGLSIFISKSGILIFGSILVLWSFFKINFKDCTTESTVNLILVSFFPLAMLANVFSLGGWGASLMIFQHWTWPLYVLPFHFLLRNQRAINYFSAGMALGFLIAILKAVTIFWHEFHLQFSSVVRVASFWDIGRWAYFLTCTSIILFGLLGQVLFSAKSKLFSKLLITAFFLLSFVFLLLANSRAPWLGAGLGLAILGILNRRCLKLLGLLAPVLLIFYLAVPGLSARFESAFSAKKENGIITSSDASNAGRLHMWKVTSDFYKENLFFGTGFNSAEKPLREFLAAKSPEYIKAYVDPQFSFSDQHNSYLLMLVQLGLLFSIYFWGSIGFIFMRALFCIFKTDDHVFKISFALFISQLFMFVFYSAVSSYEMLWFFPCLMVLSMGPKVSRKIQIGPIAP
jgi:O-antigen ligase